MKVMTVQSCKEAATWIDDDCAEISAFNQVLKMMLTEVENFV